jgi:hypothetical protein
MPITIEEFIGALQQPETAKQIMERLNYEVAQLYEQGKYDEAMGIAPDVRELARQCLGEKHPIFATSALTV